MLQATAREALKAQSQRLPHASSFCFQPQLSPETRTQVPLEILLHSGSSCWKAKEERELGSLVHREQPRSGVRRP